MEPSESHSTDPTATTTAGRSGGKQLLIGLLFLSILIAFYVFVRPEFRGAGFGAGHPAVGIVHPPLSLEPLVNTTAPLQLDELAGHVVLVNYWGPWCPPCMKEMPHLVAMEQRLRETTDFALISVSCGVGEAYRSYEQLQQETEDYSRRMDIRFPIYHDVSRQNRAAFETAAGLTGFAYPTSVLIDREGVIQAVWIGYVEGMEREVEAVTLGVLSE